MYNDVIGIVGGMGSYATLSFFERLLDAFPGEKEWDRPRILIDNRCTMPSRVRAILYQEKFEQLVDEMTDSIKNLLAAGATKIVLACNTSHHFLPMIYEKLPEAKGKICSIIDATVERILSIDGCDSVTLLASEGTIDVGIFHHKLQENCVCVKTPTGEQYGIQREIIESVKQRKITEAEIKMLKDLIAESKTNVVIIGCTEFPVVYSKIDRKHLGEKIVIDPLQCIIDKLLQEMN